MKKNFFLFVTVLLFAACSNDAKVKSETTNDSTVTAKTDEPSYPYSPSYTSKFEIGDPAHAKAILDLQKTWDNNSLDNSKPFFADSVVLYSADGSVMSGSADSIIAATKPYRTGLGTVSSKVHAWVPLKAIEANENWVLVWYTEYRKKDNGKIDSAEYQETWRLNNNGKADMLMQYERKNQSPKK